MVELAFTHLGVFFKSGFREAHFFVFVLLFLFFGAAVFVLTCFCGIPMLKKTKWCFNKALAVSFSSCLFMGFSFCCLDHS